MPPLWSSAAAACSTPPARSAPPIELLVAGGLVTCWIEPGTPAPADARVFDAHGLLMHAGLINGQTHGSTNLAKATHDRWSLELLLNGAPGSASNFVGSTQTVFIDAAGSSEFRVQKQQHEIESLGLVPGRRVSLSWDPRHAWLLPQAA